jgi:hypothetical protein
VTRLLHDMLGDRSERVLIAVLSNSPGVGRVFEQLPGIVLDGPPTI